MAICRYDGKFPVRQAQVGSGSGTLECRSAVGVTGGLLAVRAQVTNDEVKSEFCLREKLSPTSFQAYRVRPHLSDMSESKMLPSSGGQPPSRPAIAFSMDSRT